jgi:hypothetical protein
MRVTEVASIRGSPHDRNETGVIIIPQERNYRSATTTTGPAVGKARLLDRAILDPETAPMLLREQNPPNRAAMQRRAKLWLGNQASNVAEMLSEDEHDPVKDAITRPGAASARK